jgi:hypothetical protein
MRTDGGVKGGRMRGVVGVAVAAALLACGDGGPTGERFFATLGSASEVPPGNSAAAGTVNFTVRGSDLDYTVVVQAIAGVTAVRLDSGGVGAVGPVLADLYTGPTTGSIAYGTLVSGALTQARVSVPMDSLLAWMRRSTVYVNVLTAARPGGEIRGQVSPN